MLEEYLPSVLASAYTDLEVVVADNNSSDGSIQMLSERFPTVRVIALERNLGFAAGYNEALKQIDAKYFVLLNQDVEVTSNWIEPIVDLMDKDPRLAACQPKIRDYRKRTHFEYAGAAGGLLDAYAYPFCRGRIFETIEEDKGQYDEGIDCAWASGAAMFVRADLFRSFGGLDPDFIAHMEEIDLCWRFRNAGYRIACCPQSIVFHLGGASLARGNPRKTFLNFRNSIVMLIKNERGAKLLYKLPWRLALDDIAALRFLLTGQLAQWWAVVKAQLHVLFRIGLWLGKHAAIKRLTSQQQAGPRNHSGMIRGSIVWKYFARGMRTYRDLVR
jgi:GT2 family glycosyltransferase